MEPETHRELVDHLFRQEHGRMVGVLTRMFGFHQLELIEDVVQESFLSALRAWRVRMPDNPSAWLMQAAKNRAIDGLRRGRLELAVADSMRHASVAASMNELFHDREISDSQLRLIFACCHPVLEERDQIAFTLQLASGFGIREISQALLTREETIKKRLQRARRKIKEEQVRLLIPDGSELAARRASVLTVLYLMFNEGYQSASSDAVIRRDLCAEAMRLTKLVCEHGIAANSDSKALLALMCYHAARFDSRLGPDNEIILLANQDRKTWNRELINVGNYYLARADPDDQPTVFVIEAAIAAQHAISPSYAETSWGYLLTLYNALLRIKPTPPVKLSRAVVLSETGAWAAALAALDELQADDFPGSEHLYHCVCARILEQAGRKAEARDALELALGATRIEAERRLILQKLEE